MSGLVERVLKRLGLWAHTSVDHDRNGNANGLRVWVRGTRDSRASVRLELSLDPSAPGVAFSADGAESDVSAHVVVPGLGVYVGAEGLVPNRVHELLGTAWRRGAWPTDRTLKLAFHDGAVWWSLWMSEMEWRATDPQWRRGCWRPIDTLLGRVTSERVDEPPLAVEIPLPEGARPATITWSTFTHRRPRWPFVRRWRSANVEPAQPVGIPGKGENAWDCDDDALYSLSTSARDNEQAIARFVESVLRSRQRYGGSHRFTPSEETRAAS